MLSCLWYPSWQAYSWYFPGYWWTNSTWSTNKPRLSLRWTTPSQDQFPHWASDSRHQPPCLGPIPQPTWTRWEAIRATGASRVKWALDLSEVSRREMIYDGTISSTSGLKCCHENPEVWNIFLTIPVQALVELAVAMINLQLLDWQHYQDWGDVRKFPGCGKQHIIQILWEVIKVLVALKVYR